MTCRHSFMGTFGAASLLVLSSSVVAQDPQPANPDLEAFELEVFEEPAFEVPDFEMPTLDPPEIALPEPVVPDVLVPSPSAEADPPGDAHRSESSQPEQPSTDWLTEAYERVLPNAEDSWVLTIRKTRTGHDIYRWEDPMRGDWDNTHNEWHYGPASISVRLATYDGADHYGYDGILVSLALWQHRIAQWLEDIETKESYSFIADQARATIDHLKSRRDDAELLLRVMQGMQHYTIIEDGDRKAGSTKPTSTDAVAHLQGATFSSDFTSSYREPSSQTASMPPVSLSGIDALDYGPSRYDSAVIWRFVPEDMARVAVLIEDYDEIRDNLTLDISNVDLPENLEGVLELLPGYYHSETRDPFLAALYEIARVAWWIGPYEADESVWATSEDQIPDGLRDQFGIMEEHDGRLVDIAGTPYLSKTATLGLPPLETDTLVMIEMGAFGITVEPGKIPEDPYFSGSQNINNYEAKHSYSPGIPARERIRRRRSEDLFWARTLVHSTGTGENLDGRVNITSELYKIDVNPDSKARTIRDQRQTHNIVWSLSHDGEIWAPKPPEIVASIVQPDGSGGFEPIDGPLAYGSPFVVEGRLELPAARPVYNLELDYGGDRPHDVLLYPTEEDRTLLRSKLLYLMWDVAHAETSLNETVGEQ